MHREYPMPVCCADINHTLCATFCRPPDKRFGKWKKMQEAALPNPRRICDAHNKSVAVTCRRWFDGPCGGPRAVNRAKFGNPKSAACGSPRRRAYRPYRRCGRVAEGGGLLNRYRVVKPYRGFESLRLRQFSNCPARTHWQRRLLRNVNMVGSQPILTAWIHRRVSAFDMPRV
jgi:hypothetical protein